MSEQIIRVTPTEWALAMHESIGGRRFAVRHEPGYLRRYVLGKGFSDTEAYFRATSFGLWQMMGQSLRELGWQGEAREWRAWCADPARQLDFMRRWWARTTDAGEPLWRQVESWNKGDAGEDRLLAPTDYWAKVKVWLDKCPAPGPDGLVELRCKG